MALPKELITVTPLSKALAFILFIVLPFIGFFVGVRYESIQNQQPTVSDVPIISQEKNIITQQPSPSILPSIQTNGLKRYADGGRVAFLYPKEWKIMKQPQNIGDKFVAEFEMNSTVILTVSEFADFNTDPLSQHEKIEFKDYLGPEAKAITINGYKAKRLHNAEEEGHSMSFEKVAFFPKDADIIEFYFKNPDPTVDFDTAVSRWFDPLLQTVKASAMPGPDVALEKSTDEIYREAHPKQIVNITSKSIQDTTILNSYTDKILELTLRFPKTWKTGQHAGTDLYTLTLTSLSDTTTNFGFGDQAYFSRSGGLCMNESFCENVGTFTVNIEGKQYSGSIFELGSVYDSLTDNPRTQFNGYQFQIIIDGLKGKPALSGQFKNLTDGQEIANIVSTIKQ